MGVDYENAGFYAQYVAVDADNAGRVPKRMSLRVAGAGAVTGLTAYQGVADHAEVRRGETVLVFGATGAVGSLAVQFAASRGARVIGTGTGRKANELVRGLGARAVIDARSRTAVDDLRDAAPDGVDVVLAFAGGRRSNGCSSSCRAEVVSSIRTASNRSQRAVGDSRESLRR